LKGWCCKE